MHLMLFVDPAHSRVQYHIRRRKSSQLLSFLKANKNFWKRRPSPFEGLRTVGPQADLLREGEEKMELNKRLILPGPLTKRMHRSKELKSTSPRLHRCVNEGIALARC